MSSKSAYNFLLKNKNHNLLLSLIYEKWKNRKPLNINQLAKEAYWSKSSITRFFQNSGFSGFKEFKYLLQNENFEPSENIVSEDDYFENEIMTQPILSTAKMNALEKYHQAIEWLENDSCNYVVGAGGNLSVCFEFCVRLERLGFVTSHFSDIHNMFVSLTHAKPNDLVWVFSYSGETPEILHLAQQAKAHNLKVIVITRHGKSSLSVIADLVFEIDDSENVTRILPFKSRIAMTYIVYKLLSLLINQKPEFYHNRLVENVYSN